MLDFNRFEGMHTSLERLRFNVSSSKKVHNGKIREISTSSLPAPPRNLDPKIEPLLYLRVHVHALCDTNRNAGV